MQVQIVNNITQYFRNTTNFILTKSEKLVKLIVILINTTVFLSNIWIVIKLRTRNFNIFITMAWILLTDFQTNLVPNFAVIQLRIRHKSMCCKPCTHQLYKQTIVNNNRSYKMYGLENLQYNHLGLTSSWQIGTHFVVSLYCT